MQHTASIIVPVYNLAKEGMVAFCMEALLSQTFPESYQIIAVDDCSSDGSFSILKEYEKKASEINPLADLVALKTPKRSLQGAAKNLGLTKADGEWIGFIDGDDWVSPCFLEKLIALARAEGSDLAGCDL
ncbi:MAG: glycosyltransferase family 2 protein, partial [Lachnospiraceae bacterium]|nr:glycosyltransferase family 2 protein [Lachnospiraceae bacterium]